MALATAPNPRKLSWSRRCGFEPVGQPPVIVNPVVHSLSPAIHNAAFAFLDLDFIYVAHQVEDAKNALAGMRLLRGITSIALGAPASSRLVGEAHVWTLRFARGLRPPGPAGSRRSQHDRGRFYALRFALVISSDYTPWLHWKILASPADPLVPGVD
ncbi:MAG: hypothetical protein GY835_05140 [bacterium]|nr:hypothetical protein [bacterium]